MWLTYTLLGLSLGLFALGLVSEYGRSPRLAKLQRFGLVLQVAGLVATVAVLRPGEGSHRAPEALHAALASGEPVFIDVFSNY
ncbi:MAG: hypothetical protein HY909_08810 [Deltaproteobacteria bacterium]|nr:hypothetical protein [Deltaproteobacteria bacterium]